MKHDKRELQLELHPRKKHGRRYWRLRYRRLHVDGRTWEPWQRIKCDEEQHCRLPMLILRIMLDAILRRVRTQGLTTKDKSFEAMQPIVFRVLRDTPALSLCKQLSAQQDGKLGVTLFLDRKRFFAIRVLDLSQHRIAYDVRKIADALRDDNGEAGRRFRRMEEESKAPLRGAWVVLKSGFCRFVPARPR